MRFALSHKITVDLEQHILLGNDAMRAGGKMWTRSRNRIAPLEGFWRFLLKSVVPTDPVAKEHRLLRMFRLISPAISLPPCHASPYWKSTEILRSRYDIKNELSVSLLFEIEIS